MIRSCAVAHQNWVVKCSSPAPEFSQSNQGNCQKKLCNAEGYSFFKIGWMIKRGKYFAMRGIILHTVIDSLAVANRNIHGSSSNI